MTAEKTWPTASLADAMAILQTKLPEVRKTERGQAGNRETRYADLANISSQLLPLLGELGLSFSARPTMSNGQFVLAYELLHMSGENRTGEYPITGNGPQAHGSAITYARRYTLCSVTGLAPEDDDDAATAEAEAAANRGTAQRRTRPPTSGTGRTAQRGQAANRTAARADGPSLPGENDGDGATKRQLTAMHTLFTKVDMTERAERLQYVNEVLAEAVGAERQVESSTELTKDEAGRVIDKLTAWADQLEPDGSES
jgi:hypothetical protein